MKNSLLTLALISALCTTVHGQTIVSDGTATYTGAGASEDFLVYGYGTFANSGTASPTTSNAAIRLFAPNTTYPNGFVDKWAGSAATGSYVTYKIDGLLANTDYTFEDLQVTAGGKFDITVAAYEGTLAGTQIGTGAIAIAGSAGWTDRATITLASSYDVTSNVDGEVLLTFQAFAGGTNDSHFESFSFTIVPEPSTYALLAGCLALASVMVRRRD